MEEIKIDESQFIGTPERLGQGIDFIGKAFDPRSSFDEIFEEFGEDSFVMAAHFAHIDYLRFMLEVKNIDINYKDYRGWTAFKAAHARGSGATMEFLLTRGASPKESLEIQ